jgi:preprotein translocase subunit SecA
MYGKLSGMTGTADTEVEEFQKIYKLDGGHRPHQQAHGAQGQRRHRLQAPRAEKFAAVRR